MKSTNILTLIICLPLITISQNQNWTRLADFDGLGRRGAFSFAINNKGYVGSGILSNGELRKDFWEYDPVTDAWEQKENASGIPRFDAVGFSIGNKGYMGTGEIGNPSSGFVEANDFYEYDPTTNIWTIKQNVGPTVRRGASAFVIGNKGYITAGYRGVYQFDNTLYEYDPVTNVWTQKTSFSGGPREFAAGFGLNGKGYIAGGFYQDQNPLVYLWYVDLHEYNPTTNSWTLKQQFPQNVALDYVKGFSYNNKGYILGVDVSGSNVNFMEYDPVTNSIMAKQQHPTGVTNTTVFNLCDYAYTATGGAYTKEVWKNFIGSFSISNSQVICSPGGGSLILNNAPTGASVTWQASPSNLFATSSGTGTTATLIPASGSTNGLGNISFTIANACGSPIVVQKTVVVGKPAPTISAVLTSGEGEPTTYDFTATPMPEATYNWYVNNVLKQSGPNNAFEWYFPCNQSRTIKCSVTNACGTSMNSNSITLVGGCSHALMVSPNPATTDLTISFNDSTQQTLLLEAVEITLLNSNLEKVYTAKTTEKKTKVSVVNLPEGVYFLNVKNKDGIVQRRIYIDR